MVKEPETTCQEAGQKECDISRKKGQRLIASIASIKIRNEKETGFEIKTTHNFKRETS